MIPAGSINRGYGTERSLFIFSDLKPFDPQGRYSVLIHDISPIGTSIPVRIDGKIASVRFNPESFQRCFGVSELNEKTFFESILRAKAKLLKNKEENPEFHHLADLLYEGPERQLSTPSQTALKALTEYSKSEQKVLRIAAKRFGLERSFTIQGDWVATDVKRSRLKYGNPYNRLVLVPNENRLLLAPTEQNKDKVKMAKLLDDQNIVRRISSQKQPWLEGVLTQFRNTPCVMPTLAMVSYVNDKGKDVFVSYHPFFEKSLHQLMQDRPLSYDTQVKIAEQILTGMKSIHQQGMLRNLFSHKIYIHEEQGNPQVFIAGLESFIPHGHQVPAARDKWSAPEVFRDNDPPPLDEKQTVWHLGSMFWALFQKKSRVRSCYDLPKASQEAIDAAVRQEGYPPPIAAMLQGMLQVDPKKRWSLQQVTDYFQQKVVGEFEHFISALRGKEIDPDALAYMQAYAKEWGQTIRFSRRYFGLEESATAAPNFAAADIRRLIAKNRAKIKLARLSNGELVVRRIQSYDPKTADAFHRFRNRPYVLPTLEMLQYVNKEQRFVFVSYHPLFDASLYELLIEKGWAPLKEQIRLCHQIILGMEEIHKEGIHGDLYLRNVLFKRTSQGTDFSTVISDLELFTPYGTAVPEVIKSAAQSAPEIRNASSPHFATGKHDVWSLGLMFCAIFQQPPRRQSSFVRYTQEEIYAKIKARRFPPEVQKMIESMLQIDPAERATLQQISEYFRKHILPLAAEGDKA